MKTTVIDTYFGKVIETTTETEQITTLKNHDQETITSFYDITKKPNSKQLMTTPSTTKKPINHGKQKSTPAIEDLMRLHEKALNMKNC